MRHTGMAIRTLYRFNKWYKRFSTRDLDVPDNESQPVLEFGVLKHRRCQWTPASVSDLSYL